MISSTEPWQDLAPEDPSPWSLHHTYHRFQWPNTWVSLCIVPSTDAHIDCIAINFERSHSGLPYPKLDVFAQSLLDTNNGVDLADLIDGMDLQVDWGEQNLNLDNSTDVEWTEKQNEKIMASVDYDENRVLLQYFSGPTSRRELWQRLVAGKERRMGPELPEGWFSTRFRPINSPDPRCNTDRLGV